MTPTGQTSFLFVIPAGTRLFVHRIDLEAGHEMVLKIMGCVQLNLLECQLICLTSAEQGDYKSIIQPPR